MTRRLLSLAGACALVMMAGCFQVEQKWIVYSDGSGKFVQTMTIDQQQAAMLKNMAPPGSGGGGGAPGTNMADTIKGTVGQKMQMVAIAYFEDISKVEQPGINFVFSKHDDGGCDLKMGVDFEKIKAAAAKNAPGALGGGGGDEGGDDLGEKKGEGDEGKDEGKEGPSMGGFDPGMMEGMMSQMKNSIVIVMPGDVTSTSRGDKAGRIVTYVMEGADLAKPKEKTITIEASCGAPTKEAKADFEEFQKELEAAKKGEAAGSGDGK